MMFVVCVGENEEETIYYLKVETINMHTMGNTVSYGRVS